MSDWHGSRSGLVTALVLMLDGHSATEAVNLLRARWSPWALCNDAFVGWLVTDDAALLDTAAGRGTRV